MKELKTHCGRGHEFTAENSGINVSGGQPLFRYCRTCRNEYQRQERAARFEGPRQAPKRAVARCSIAGCEKEEEAAGLCCGHRKRKTREQAVSVSLGPARRGPDLREPWEVLTEAALAYADADVGDDAAFTSARKKLAYAARVYCSARKG